MKLFATLCLVFTTLLAVAQPRVAAFVSAERAFAQKALETTTKTAFLTYMADSAIVFVNGKPAPAKPYWEQAPESPAKLIWGPAVADASRSGDMGYTTGPWYVEVDGKRVAHGHYNTVWSTQRPDNRLRFLIDAGVQHPAPSNERIPDSVLLTAIKSQASSDKINDLLRLELQLADQILARGAAPAYLPYLSQEARLYRPNQFPFVSAPAIRQLLLTELPLRFKPIDGQVALSGDLGYVYGLYQSGQSREGGYLRIWKHEIGNGWRLVLEVLNETSKTP
ncbi:hypothetical protein GCM10023187_25310 [Nibrella viscosa]|uniref:Ketosteroid isomerase homolog n=1 Tax=Nibrella viscosa TaxID=1084524 RepID=A0ABP8KH89_9BACT